MTGLTDRSPSGASVSELEAWMAATPGGQGYVWILRGLRADRDAAEEKLRIALCDIDLRDDRIERAEADRDALIEYAEHWPECVSTANPLRASCTCGLAEVLPRVTHRSPDA